MVMTREIHPQWNYDKRIGIIDMMIIIFRTMSFDVNTYLDHLLR